MGRGTLENRDMKRETTTVVERQVLPHPQPGAITPGGMRGKLHLPATWGWASGPSSQADFLLPPQPMAMCEGFQGPWLLRELSTFPWLSSLARGSSSLPEPFCHSMIQGCFHLEGGVRTDSLHHPPRHPGVDIWPRGPCIPASLSAQSPSRLLYITSHAVPPW